MNFNLKFFFFAIFALICSGTFLSAFAPSNSAALYGSVADLSGEPSPNYHIGIHHKDGRFIVGTTTNALGEFQFAELQPGNYNVTLSFAGVGWFMGEVQLGKGESFRLNIVDGWSETLPRNTAVPLSGSVADASGAPHSGVIVSATNAVTRTKISTVTTYGSAPGKYYFPNLGAGTYILKASLSGYETFSTKVQLGKNVVAEQNISLVKIH